MSFQVMDISEPENKSFLTGPEVTQDTDGDRQQDVLPHRSRIALYTILFCFTFICIGLTVSLIGPTFLDLLLIASSDIETGSFILSAGSLGYLIGNMVAGFVLEKTNPALVVGLFTGCAGILICLIPQFPSVTVMSILNAAQSLGLGMTDIGVHTLAVQQTGNQLGPVLQILHFGYSFGGIIGPLIAEPFISKEVNENSTEMASVDNKSSSIYQTPDRVHEVEQDTGTRIQIAYIIVGWTTILSGVSFLLMHCLFRTTTKSMGTVTEVEDRHRMPNALKIILLALLAAFCAFYASSQITFANFLTTFVVDYLDWRKSDGALVTTVFWGSMALGRFIGIFVAAVVKPWTVMAVDAVLIDVAFIMFILGGQRSVAVVWVTSALAGAGMASIYATAFTWTNEGIMPLTSRITSFLVTFSSIGATVSPILLGYLFENYTPAWFLYLTLGESLAFTLIFFLIPLILRAGLLKSR